MVVPSNLVWNKVSEMEPGIYELLPARYMQCTTYLVKGEEGAFIIDPGSGQYEEHLVENL